MFHPRALAFGLAGWLMLHKETRFKFSRYLSIFEDKTHQHHWLVGWLAGWAGWLGGVGWLAVCGCGLADWLWLPGWLAVAAWLVGYIAVFTKMSSPQQDVGT